MLHPQQMNGGEYQGEKATAGENECGCGQPTPAQRLRERDKKRDHPSSEPQRADTVKITAGPDPAGRDNQMYPCGTGDPQEKTHPEDPTPARDLIDQRPYGKPHRTADAQGAGG